MVARMHRRSPAQRWTAARYDGAHAFLVRLVHPLCFAAFSLVVAAAAAGLTYVFLNLFDEGGIAFAVAIFACAALAAGFKFVATPISVGVGIVALAGWAIALFAGVELPTWLLWVLVAVACLSLVIQLVLLIRAIPDRWRNGLMHLMWPAALGTVLGALPVAVLILMKLDDRDEAVRDIAAYAFVAGCAVLTFLLALHVYARRGDEKVVAEFAARHGLTPGSGDIDLETAPLITVLTPKFGTRTPWWTGMVRDRKVEVVTGYTSSWAPDLPSLHITVLGIALQGRGRDIWVRRNSWSHDNVLASLGRSEVMRFESIRLSEEFSVRFAAGIDELTAFLTIGPELVHVLGEQLGEAQVCRVGATLTIFVVGGAIDADELDTMLDTGSRVAHLLERTDAVTPV